MPELSEGEQVDVEAGRVDSPPLKTETMAKEGTHLLTDGNMGKSSDLLENLPSEVEVNADIPSASASQLQNDSEQKDLFDANNEIGTELVSDKLENSNRALETDIKADEDGQFNDTLVIVKNEGSPGEYHTEVEGLNQLYSFNPIYSEGDDSGTEEEQAAFMRELDNFFKERNLEFKPPKFYGEGLNCLKLWRAVTRLGGYDQVTTCKLWRQVGESFKPPKTCTTVSWSFRCFYEKALLDYEKYKIHTGELQVPISSISEPISVENQTGGNQASGSSGRARRDAAARAMQGWHSQRLLGNGEVGDPIIKDKTPVSLVKRDKHLKSIGSLKRKKSSSLDRAAKVAHPRIVKPQTDSVVVDVGPLADWVKINVRRTKDCFEVYALVPGLLREEIHVQSDPEGRLIISGEPEQPDNPWGVTPFKKIITLPSRIDPHQTSAVVTLHGQLFVRAPFEQSEL